MLRLKQYYYVYWRYETRYTLNKSKIYYTRVTNPVCFVSMQYISEIENDFDFVRT